RDGDDVHRHLDAVVQPPARQDERQRPPGGDRLRRGLARVPDRPALGPARSTAMKRIAHVIVFLALGCAELEGNKTIVPVPAPTIVASGAHSVWFGDSVTISVTTAEAEDASYTFTSADPSIATVNGAG